MWLPHDAPALLFSLAPVISLLFAVAIAVRRHEPEPDIHDRYLDYILGLALLGLATASMQFLPASLSLFFWSWRLDVLVVAVFLAGAIVLLSGARALWRFRLPVALLLLAWPLPYALLSLPLLIVFGLRTFSRRPRTSVSPASARRPGGGLIAVGLVGVAMALVAVADQQVNAASHLLHANGRPLVTDGALPPATLGAFHRINAGNSGLPSWGLKGTTSTYGHPAIALNLFLPADSRDLALPPATVAQRQGYRLQGERRLNLGDGLIGRLETYASPTAKTLFVIWWDWPVQTSSGVARERVIAEQAAPRDAQPDRVLDFARAYVASMASTSALP